MTDFVVRAWKKTNAGHARATVVDMHGRIAHVTVTAQHAAHGEVADVIRRRLEAMPEWKGYRQ